MTASNYKYFDYARSVAALSDFKRNKVGCIAVLGNKVISVGYNTSKTHPLQKYYNQYRNFDNDSDTAIHKLHAEIHCLSSIRYLDIDWNKVDLYIYRICKSRTHGISRPCSACMEFIKSLQIRNIYYTGNESYCYERLDYGA